MSANINLGGQTDKSQSYLRPTRFEYDALGLTQRTLVFGAGKKKLTAIFRGPATATARFAYLAFNATNAVDGKIIMETPGLRWAVPINEPLVFYFSNTALLTRLDAIADQAETGVNRLILITGE